MKTILLLFAVLATSCVTKRNTSVDLAELLKHPESYHEKQIITAGVLLLELEFSVLQKNDHNSSTFNFSDSIWLDLSGFNGDAANIASLIGHPVKISGTLIYSKQPKFGQFGHWSAELSKITNIRSN
jgi:hypothetical protein